MLLKRQIFLLLFLCLGHIYETVAANITLDLKLSEPASVKIKDKEYRLNGDYKDGSLSLGKGLGINLPAQSIFMQTGSLAFDFKCDDKDLKMINRHFLTVRGKGRLYITTYLPANQRRCYLAFRSYINSNSLKTIKDLSPGTWYRLLITWNGEKVKFYLNGELQGEEKQSIKAEFPYGSKLYLGPYEARGISARPWEKDSCFIRNLKVWDDALSTKEVLNDCGKKIASAAEKYPAFLQVPKMKVPPVIDGNIDEKAWDTASSFVTLNDIKNLSGTLTYQDNRPLVGHDGKNLYLSFQTVFPNDAKLLSGNKRIDKDVEVWGDESYEIHISIKGRMYRFAGNVAGGYCESLDTNSSFNAQWTYRSSCKFRIDNRWVWQAEIAIPFASIGIKDIAKEPEIKLNFCRTWRCMSKLGVTMLGMEGGYGDIKNFATLKLSNSTIATQTRKLINPNFGCFENVQSFYSGSDNNIRYQIKLLDDAGAVPENTLVDSKIKLKNSENIIQTYKSKITSSSFNRMLFSVSDAENNLILQQLIPFELSDDYIEAIPLFSKGQILFTVRYSVLHEKLPNEIFSVLLRSPDGKIIAEKKISSDKKLSLKFDRQNPKGEYSIQVIDSRREVLDQEKISYPGKSSWEGLDETSRIIPPFTPLQIKNSADQLEVSMWNRKYNFERSSQPSQIQSGNTQLLSSPAQLQINNNNLKIELFKVTENNSAHVGYELYGNNNDYEFSQKSFIEYDGVIFNKLTVNAKKDLTDIRLVLPLDGKYSKFVHATNAGFGGGGRRNIAVDRDLELKYYPSIWIGNQEKGLVFFAESDINWLGRKNLPISIKHASRSNTLIVTFADKLNAGQKIDLEFGLLATPVKPLPRNYPLNTFNWSQAINLNQSPPKVPVTYANLNCWEGAGFFDLPLDGKEKSTSAWLKKNIKNSEKCHSIFTPYMAAMFFPEEYGEAKANLLEWQKTPANHLHYKRDGKTFNWYCTCAKSSARKFFIHKFAELLKQQPVKGVYFDFGAAFYCNNELHGCKGGYPMMAQRKLYQGIARAFVDAGIKDYVIVVHNSECVQFPSFTHATHFFNGEGIRQMSSDTFHNGKDLQDTYTLLDFATEHSSLPWGITSSVYVPVDPLLKRFGGGKEDQELYRFRMTKAALAGTLIHDTICSPQRMHYGIFDKIVRFYDKFGVSKAEFMPYWRNQKYVKVLKGKNIYVSIYYSKANKEVLAVISHVGREHLNQNVEIELFPQAFGLKSFTKAKELFTSPDPEYNRLYAEKNRIRNPVKQGDYGVKFEGLEKNRIKLHLDFHSVALVKLIGDV